jgi:hypothetical protein
MFTSRASHGLHPKQLRRLFLSDPFPVIGVCSVLLIVEFRHEWVRGGVRIFSDYIHRARGSAVRRSARGSAGKGADHLLHCSANLSQGVFRSADDCRAGTAEDELVRAYLHDVENHPVIGVVAHVGVSARRAGPHAVGAVAVRPRLEPNQRRILSQ